MNKGAARFAGKGASILSGRRAGAHPLETTDLSSRLFVLPIPVAMIELNPDQPRKKFNEQALKELADSIKEHGLLKPIILKEIEPNVRYQLMAGERRWRAHKIAGIEKIPAIIKNASADSLVIALIENIQRENLSPAEESQAFMILAERGHSQAEIEKLTSKSRPHISKALKIGDFLKLYIGKYHHTPQTADGKEISQEALYHAATMGSFEDGELFLKNVISGNMGRPEIRAEVRKSRPSRRTVVITSVQLSRWLRKVRTTLHNPDYISKLRELAIPAEDLDSTIKDLKLFLKEIQQLKHGAE